MPRGYGDFSALNDAEIDNDENSSVKFLVFETEGKDEKRKS